MLHQQPTLFFTADFQLNYWQLNSHLSTNYFISLYSTELLSAGLGSSLYRLGTDPTEISPPTINLFLWGLLSNSWDIVDVFTGRYQVTHSNGTARYCILDDLPLADVIQILKSVCLIKSNICDYGILIQ
jgi:hypothetical protein